METSKKTFAFLRRLENLGIAILFYFNAIRDRKVRKYLSFLK